MTLSIGIESPLTDEALGLIEGSEAALREHYPPEECFSFDPQELASDHVYFFVARENDKPMGCVALADYTDYGEVKRLFVKEEGRSKGTAKALMDALHEHALSLNLPHVRLETGPKLAAAVRLYRRLGYTTCPVFGDYEDIEASLFMEKAL